MGTELAGSFILTLGLLILALYLIRLLHRRAGGGTREGRIEILERVNVGPKQGVALIRVGHSLLAVSTGDGGVHPLLLLDEPAESPGNDASTPIARPAVRPFANGYSFKTLLAEEAREVPGRMSSHP